MTDGRERDVQPKEGRKELAPREIKFRYRRLDTTIRERAGSSQVPREAQESERYPGLYFFVGAVGNFSYLFGEQLKFRREGDGLLRIFLSAASSLGL